MGIIIIIKRRTKIVALCDIFLTYTSSNLAETLFFKKTIHEHDTQCRVEGRRACKETLNSGIKFVENVYTKLLFHCVAQMIFLSNS